MARRKLCANPDLQVLLAAAEGWALAAPEQCPSPAFHRVSLSIRKRGRMGVHLAEVCVWHAHVLAERHGAQILPTLASASP
jgi:hypothetical protein